MSKDAQLSKKQRKVLTDLQDELVKTSREVACAELKDTDDENDSKCLLTFVYNAGFMGGLVYAAHMANCWTEGKEPKDLLKSLDETCDIFLASIKAGLAMMDALADESQGD